MTQVTVAPSNIDNSLAFIFLVLASVIALVSLGIFAFNEGWISMSTSDSGPSVDATVPPVSSSPISYPGESEY